MSTAKQEGEYVEIVVEWSFEPQDYFEDAIEIAEQGYTMLIDNGRVTARISPDVFAANQALIDSLHTSLTSRFLGVQLVSHRGFVLSDPRVVKVRPDGLQDYEMAVKVGMVDIATGFMDVRIVKEHGDVIADSKRDRIEKKKRLSGLVARHSGSDQTLRAMLQGNKNAANDPSNELVHLYEIRDAASKALGGDTKARSILEIPKASWSRFGLLCNEEPLRQGRHRGKATAGLRDATTDELNEARSTASLIVERYLEYIEARSAD